MKKNTKILTALGIGMILLGSILWICNSPSPTLDSPTPTNMVDTTKYTDVVLINRSDIDSVQVFVTLESHESIVGKFGMDSTNYNPKVLDSTLKPAHFKGIFWAKKNVEYHWGDTNPINGALITFGVDNQECPNAQKEGYKFGINNFEFTVNTWWQNGVVTGKGESFDITCVDGLHSVLKQTVTSFGPRNNVGKNPNFSAYWDYGYKADEKKFKSSMNGINFLDCINIPGVYPYRCDIGYKTHFATPCNTIPPYPVKCSDKWGAINTSQTNRQGQGGQVTCEFLGFTKNLQPGIKLR